MKRSVLLSKLEFSRLQLSGPHLTVKFKMAIQGLMKFCANEQNSVI